MIRKKGEDYELGATLQTGRHSDQFNMRMPRGLRDRIKAAAKRNNRSMSAEIVVSLQTSLHQEEQRILAGTTSVTLPIMSQGDFETICGMKNTGQIAMLPAEQDMQAISGHDALREKRAHQRQFCRLTFLKKNEGGFTVVCQETDDWETCTVGPAGVLSTYGEQTFSTTETYQRDALLHLLEQAYERGRADKAREIRTVLEIGK